MSPAAKIGLFILVGLVVLGAFIVKIEDIPIGERGERLVVKTVLPTAAGVDRNAPVRIAGVRVGKVAEIRLEGGKALLVLSLDPGIELREGSRVQVTSLGMLGDRYVEILPGDPAAPLLAAGTTLEGAPVPSFDDILRAATDIGGDFREVSSALRRGIGGDQGAATIAEIAENLREITASLRDLIRTNQENVNATTANFRDFSATLAEQLPQLTEKINRLADQLNEVVTENREDARESLHNIRDVSDKLRTTADNLNAITGKIAAGEGSIGKLVNDEETVDNLNETLDSLDSGVASLQEMLDRSRRWRLAMVVRGETLPSASESRTSFGFDLWTTDERFFRVEGVDAPFGQTRTTTETVTTEHDDGTVTTYTQTKVKTEDKIRLNAQIGYRLLPETAVRAGLFEGSGGIALDHDLLVWERPLRLSLEAYDLSRDDDSSPHLRLEGRYFLTNSLFVSAGWDDPMFSDHSSYLLGAGVTWNDEDVKYSLGLAGSAVR
jgi:phospholipid/cholesterol/gamma-HCH transport system substrate-binding protein